MRFPGHFKAAVSLVIAPVAFAPVGAWAQPSPVPAPGADEDRARAINCLASAVLYEAAHEPLAGQQAVAEVVMNRVRSPAYPNTVCGVVFQGSHRRTGCQFTFTCDGSLRKVMPARLVAQATAVAIDAIDGRTAPRANGASHYHADYVRPYWAPSLVRVATIGRHIFYRLPGAQAGAAIRPYQPVAEPVVPSLQSLAGASPAMPEPQHRAPIAEQRAAFMPWGLAPTGQAAPTNAGALASNE
ncbi:MAG: hypothetical protein B7Z33_08220 [Sphingomonadales bacterium 12-68-11]|nr:MAG: hypothetical protein B7Z33_08220 [Sphingomonadales bacterium 12-68-11]